MNKSKADSPKLRGVMLVFLYLYLISCSSDVSEKFDLELNEKEQEIKEPKTALHELTLDSDPFTLCSNHRSQKAVFEAIFSNKNAYRIPGNPSKESLSTFYDDLQKGYDSENNTLGSHLIQKGYHTFTHAIDVLTTTHALLECGGSRFLKDFEQTAILLAAIGHDALHLGVNNQFLINTDHPLIQDFGEHSLQEKRSLDYLLGLIKKHDLFRQSDASTPEQNNQIKRSLKLIKEAILYTDFKRHKELMSRMGEKIPSIIKASQEQNIDISMRIDDDTRSLIASFILHTADVSNPGKKWPVCERWANLVMAEFFGQGDLEKENGMKPSMNCDRDSVLIPECQLGFGKYVVHDIYTTLSQIIPDGGNFLLRNLNENQQRWQRLKDQSD